MATDKIRRQIEKRLLESKTCLSKTQSPDEEERLLNELLYLQGAVAALDHSDGRNNRLLRTLQREE